MKRLLLFLLVVLCDIEFTHYTLQSCPTCIGNGSQTSAPFFSDECYEELKNSFDLNTTTTGEY